MVTHVTKENFAAEVRNAKGIVIADFWAEWCGPCKRYGPEFEAAAAAHSDKAKFVKVNVDQAEDLAAEFGVMSIPTTIFFKNGQQVDEAVGILSRDALLAKIRSHQ